MPARGGGGHLGVRAPAALGPARAPVAGARASPALRPGSRGLVPRRGLCWQRPERGGGPGTMAELLRSLQDSQLVARFQRRCGLFPAPEDDPREDGAGPGEGAARAPGVAHRPAVHGKGGGAPANGLLRGAAPQVSAGPGCAGVGGREGAAAPRPAAPWSGRPRAGDGRQPSLRGPRTGRHPGSDPAGSWR